MSDFRLQLPPDPYHRPDQDNERIISEMPGPQPLRQVRVASWRRRRRVVVSAVFALTVGLLLAVLNGPKGREFLAPGPLSSQHAQILAGQGGDRCAACHGAASSQWLGWTTDTFTGGQSCPTSQSDLCLKCHQKTIKREYVAAAHTTAPNRLTAISDRQAVRFQLAGFRSDLANERNLACSACHVEHHGPDFNLARLADAQCQTCHIRQFQRFESDHAEFAIQPGPLPRAIQFDHKSHMQKYFHEKNKEFKCATCHIGDPSQNVMRLASFELACAECHGTSVHSASDAAVILLELPILDLAVLENAGANVGEWPQAAQGDFDGRIHPWAWELLRQEPEISEILARRGFDFEFSDVDPTEPQSLQDAAALARGLKQVLNQLARGHRNNPPNPANSISGREMHDFLPPSQFFQDVQLRWFPAECRIPTSLSYDWNPTSPLLNWQEANELLAENPLAGLRGKIATSSQIPATGPEQHAPAENKASREVSSRDEINRPPYDPPHGRTDDKSVGGRVESKPESRPLRTGLPGRESPQAANLQTGGEWLAQNPLATLNGKNTDSIDNLETQRKSNAPPHVPIVNQSTEAPAIEPVFSPSFAAQLPSSGWYRNDSACRIEYRPHGHADSVVSQMKSVVDRYDAIGDQTLSTILRKSLAGESSPGKCAQCHVSLSTNEGRTAGWKSELRIESARGFTRFNHAPHLIQMECQGCHQWSESLSPSPTRLANWTDSRSETRGHTNISNFEAITRDTCAKCHRQNQAPNSCTTCHRYHVD